MAPALLIVTRSFGRLIQPTAHFTQMNEFVLSRCAAKELPELARFFPISFCLHRLQRIKPTTFASGCGWLSLVMLLIFGSTGTPLLAQSTNTFEFSIQPPAGTPIVAGTTIPIFVTITNFTIFTNLTVTGTFASSVNVPFQDAGTLPDLAPADGVFSGNLTVPLNLNGSQPLEVVISGEDISDPTTNYLVAVTNVVDYLIVTRPANDQFTNAIKLPRVGGTFDATNSFATIEPAEPFHALVTTVDASVWWTFSSPVTTNVLIDTAGSSFEPVIAVYRGNALFELSPVASSTNDPINGLKAYVNFDAMAGLTYRIAVAGYEPSGTGNIHLRVIPGGQPDLLPPIVGITNPISGTLFSTNQIMVTGFAQDDRPHDTGVTEVWMQVNEDLPQLIGIGTNWFNSVTLLPGENLVRVVAFDLAGNASFPFEVLVRYMNPTNDNFTSSILLPGTNGIVTAINGRATVEPGEPFHGGNEGGHSIWYSWLAPRNGTLRLTTAGSNFDTLLGLYIGDQLTNLITVAGNDDFAEGIFTSELNQVVVSNQVYHIAVDGFGGASGDILLEYDFTRATNDQFLTFTANASLGGTVTPPSGLYLAGSTLVVTAVPSRDFEFVGWEGDVISVENPLIVTLTSNVFLTARFVLKNLTDTFELGDLKSLPWETAGAAPWHVQSQRAAGGRYSVRSGSIDNGQSSSLVLVVNTFAGTASFELSVSSEANWDALEFYLNGVRLQDWSGEVDWRRFMFKIPAGINHLEWRYTKDANFSQGLDAAFIDNVYVPIDLPPPPTLAGFLLPGGVPELVVNGPVNSTIFIFASPDLKTWELVWDEQAPTGTIRFRDASARGKNRFYRAFAR
jgi:hypothetical protein